MTTTQDRTAHVRTDLDRLLRGATVVYLTGWLLHGADHFRRGTDVVTHHVQGLGAVGAVVAIVTGVLVFRRHPWAPSFAALVVLPTSLLLIAVHLLPSWGVWSDAFPGGAPRGVTTFSWLAVLIESVGKLGVGLIGLAMVMRKDTRSVAT
jgi:hypothetical protein